MDQERGRGADAGESLPEREGTPGGGGGRQAFLLRLSPELLKELRSWAASELRSLNGHIEFLLREAVRRRRPGDSA